MSVKINVVTGTDKNGKMVIEQRVDIAPEDTLIVSCLKCDIQFKVNAEEHLNGKGCPVCTSKVLVENSKFNKRMFLTECEWNCYMRRKPVRYIKKKKMSVCAVCGKEGTKHNQLENAHIVGFAVGLTYFGLTPEFLDIEDNIVTAHKRGCNSDVEYSISNICNYLKNSLEVSELPDYLPEFVHDIFTNI